MNREIKFRTWEIRPNNESYMRYSDDLQKISNPTKSIRKKNKFGCILMQYINKIDKNKKEIYESDIVKSEEGYKGIVKWAEDRWFVAGFHIMGWDSLEIIGNIYENKNLLNQ